LDGNVCRCTGYRGILDAWQSFAIDNKPIDIEELYKLKCLNNNSKNDCKLIKKKIHIINNNNDDNSSEWYYPKLLTDLYALLDQYKDKTYIIVSGGTGKGVYKNDGPYSVYIDIRNITDFYSIIKTSNLLQIGSMTSIEKLINVCNKTSSNTMGFEYLKELTSHWLRIGNRHIRSIGTWAGNIMLKYKHNEFSSDLFLTLETVNATITIIGPDEKTPPRQLKPSELLMQPSLNGNILFSVNFQPFDSGLNLIKTYKVAIRSQNSHCYVNAGFKFEIDNNLLVKSLPNMVFGGINDTFIHAVNTENYLLGKNLNNQDTFKAALAMLYYELQPDSNPVRSDPQYRRNLACSLFYKFILYANNNTTNKINPRLESAIDDIIDKRQISSGVQNYGTTNPSMYPVSKPMTKTNALQQASGEAQYVYDMGINKNELNGVFIVSNLANCRIDKIDISMALSMPGVCKILLAKDIPGINSNFI
jgi:xanthine dehydrogenase/oxidase